MGRTRAPEPPAAGDVERLRDLYSRRWIGNDELKRIEQDSGRPFRRGRFTKAEVDAADAAVAAYLRHKRLDRAEFIQAMFVRNNERTALRSEACADFFVQVAQQLEGRPVINVYHFLRRRLHPSNTGEAWGAAEDAELRRLHLLHGPQWERIGREMGKFHVACRDRFRKIQAAYHRGPWAADEAARLEAAYARAEAGARPEGVATWTFIADQVQTRSANQCQWKWTENLLFRAMHPATRRLDWDLAEDRLLVSRIYDLGIEHQSEINFAGLCRGALAKFTTARVRHRWGLLRKRIRHADALPIDDVCELLMRELAPLSPELLSDSEITDLSSSSDKE